MDADVEHLGGLVEDVVGPVAVVNVPVEHQHTPDVQPVERMPGRDGHVVEQAEAHRPRRLGMVAGRAQPAKRDLRFPRNQRGHGAHRAAGRVQRRLERAARTRPCPCRASRRRARSPPRSGPRTPPGAPPPATARSAAGASCGSSPSHPRPSSSCSIARIRAGALGVVARVVLERGGMVQVEAAGHRVGRAGGAARGGYRTAR